MNLTFGSVCSGIEAASVAWNRLGWRAAWLAEIEPAPSKLLAYHYPDVPNLGDMRKIPALLRNGSIFLPDVFCGGTPCQAFSLAGLRESLADERGNLSLKFCEIANELDIQRAANGLLPAVIVWENVLGVLSTTDNAFGSFLAGLAGEDEALVPEACPATGKSSRYWKWNKKTGKHIPSWPKSGCVIGPQRAVAWRTFDAQYFDVAQRRARVFVVASSRTDFDPSEVLFEFDGLRRDSPPSRKTVEDTAAGTLRSTDGGCDVDHARADHLQPVAGTLTASYGEQTGQDLMDMPGGLQVAPARSVALRGREGGGTAELGDDLANCLRASTGGGDKPHVLAPTSYAIQAGALRTNPNSGPDGVGVQPDIAYTLEARAEVQAVAFSCKDYGADASVELAPTMRAMGHSGSHANAGGQLAVCVTGDITHTLKAEGFDASEDGTGRGQPIVTAFKSGQSEAAGGVFLSQEFAPTLQAANNGSTAVPAVQYGMAVRRLTPRECERLQGFQWRCDPSYPGAWQDADGTWWSPDYTLVPIRQINAKRAAKLRAEGEPVLQVGTEFWQMAADGPRYKQLGNSWAIPNVYWIGNRIDQQLMRLIR